jgi:hypothetical protein
MFRRRRPGREPAAEEDFDEFESEEADYDESEYGSEYVEGEYGEEYAEGEYDEEYAEGEGYEGEYAEGEDYAEDEPAEARAPADRRGGSRRSRRRGRGRRDAPLPVGHGVDITDWPGAERHRLHRGAADRVATTGPFDLADAPADDRERLDLGALKLPALEGAEFRVEIDQATGHAVAVSILHGQGMLQVGVFAAPRSQAIWREIRAEIAEAIRQAGGSCEEATGPFGVELRANAPAELPGRGVGLQPLRFLGVDGPRWFLRGLISGRALEDRATAERFEETFSGIVVDRGNEAMAPRDPLPLTLPPEARQALGLESAPEGPYVEIDPFTRGPEITETR